MATKTAKLVTFQANVKTSRSGGRYHCTICEADYSFDFGQDAERHLRTFHRLTKSEAERAVYLSNK
jgi:hypothetical protein